MRHCLVLVTRVSSRRSRTRRRPPASQTSLTADGAAALAPGVTYDAKIPTLKTVLGYDAAERITTPDGITTYLKALQAAAPSMTGCSNTRGRGNGRPLSVLIVASAERMAAIDHGKQRSETARRSARPRAADAEALLARAPVVTWLMHAVHGDEISSSDAALMEAYHLLAARGDAAVDTILRESIVVIDPLENPDGRARFIALEPAGRGGGARQRAAVDRARPAVAQRPLQPLSLRHEPRLVRADPARDARPRRRSILEWSPHVVVDLHEMGGDSSYYFAPPADPLNPHITKSQQKWFDAFGRANGATFDARGFAYFIREVYDSFYPGYGESWPIFQGAIGMTYEQASARGLRYRRDDDDDARVFRRRSAPLHCRDHHGQDVGPATAPRSCATSTTIAAAR